MTAKQVDNGLSRAPASSTEDARKRTALLSRSCQDSRHIVLGRTCYHVDWEAGQAAAVGHVQGEELIRLQGSRK
jgi:hypothetical protein